MAPRALRIPALSLVVPTPLWHVRAFLGSGGDLAYDQLVASGTSPRNRITTADVTAINTFMTARSPLKDWTELTAAGSISQLRRIDPAWNLFTTSDRIWREADIPAQLYRLFDRVTGKGIGISRATKLLHVKRPDLIPICDSYVTGFLGIHGDPAAVGVAVAETLRAQRKTLVPVLRDLQRELRAIDGIRRSYPRIADALIWGAQPVTPV